MNRRWCLALIGALSAALSIGAWLAFSPAPPAVRAASDTLRVPDDYPTIQAAINAAADGDTILVRDGPGGGYQENVTVTKGITLSGGWNISFTEQSIPTTLSGGRSGRVISISSDSGVAVVALDYFWIIDGDATGLGGVTPPGAVSDTHPMPSGQAAAGAPLSAAERLSRLRAVAQADAPQAPPVIQAALERALARLERIWSRMPDLPPPAGERAASAPAQGEVDCGGGIYSDNAGLILRRTRLSFNVASRTGEGYGGAVCLVNAPAGGAQFIDVVADSNIASTADVGRGGAVYVDGAAPGAVRVSDSEFHYNIGTQLGDYGAGGGLYISDSPSATIESTVFLENVGNDAGHSAAGGGVYLDNSPFALVRANAFTGNAASAAWLGFGGVGGGLQVRLSDGVAVEGNLFNDNLAMVHGGVLGGGHGGGLYAFRSNDIQIAGNTVRGNWGIVHKIGSDDFGGGLGIDTLAGARILSNTIEGNITAVHTHRIGLAVAYAGGVYGNTIDDTVISGNVISGNVAGTEMACHGGGLYLESASSTVIEGNDIVGNTAAAMDGGGNGGGLDLRFTNGVLVRRNQFARNLASALGQGRGGGLVIETWATPNYSVTLDGNLFRGNMASQDSQEYQAGGAIAAVMVDSLAIVNNVLSGNAAGIAGGMLLVNGSTLPDASSQVANNTLAGNAAEGILLDGWIVPVTVVNNIVASHTVGVSVTAECSATLRYNLWNANGADIGGPGVISHTHPVTGPAAFVDPAEGDYRLTVRSAARDAGDPAGIPPAPAADADGFPRPFRARVDIGAYEWHGGMVFVPVVGR
jgi:hypothetical protein